MNNGKKYEHITIEYGDFEHNDMPAYKINNNKSGQLLGYIYFFPEWKQYVFSSYNDIVFSVSCLNDIIDFIENELQTINNHVFKV